MTFVDSGNLLTDKQTINDSFEWNTQTEWEAFQSKTDIQIVSGVVKLADFLPSDIASLAHWYDATEITGSDGDAIGTWADKEGTVDLTQGTSSKKPTLKTGVLNSENVLRFDGSDDFLAGGFSSDITEPLHIFMVFQGQSNPSDNYLFDSNDGTSRQWFKGTTGNWDYVRLSWGTTDTNAHIFTGLADGSNSVARLDGTQQATGTIGNDMDGVTIASRYSDSGHANVDVGELIVYDTELSTADRDAVESYLSDKWGITI